MFSRQPIREEFVYGGLAWRLEGGAHVAASLAPFVTVHAEAPATPRGEVVVRIAVDERPADTARHIAIAREGTVAAVTTANARARIVSHDGSRFEVDAVVGRREGGYVDLVQAVCSVVHHELGAVTLHAAAVLTERGAVLFVGPSGAGKTTACRQMIGLPRLARDRVAVFRTGDTWLAHGLFGGSPDDREDRHATTAPLAAILRVQQSGTMSRITREKAHRATYIVRAAMLTLDDADESVVLDRAAELARGTFIGSAEVLLHEDLRAIVDDALSGEPRGAAA